jgi:hypothetical protein
VMGTLEGMQQLANSAGDKGASKLIDEMLDKNGMLATHIKSQVSV